MLLIKTLYVVPICYIGNKENQAMKTTVNVQGNKVPTQAY